MALPDARSKRGDIQGLRAVAILTVVVFHAFHGVLPGGFVGVDVFFVISGFLIAGLLIREQNSTGTISLSAFWARRVRRLMPATLVVAIVTLVVASVRLDPLPLVRVFYSAAWSLLSLANVYFANTPAGGYFANPVPNPFLHFWSLSVEEQFYIFLPLLLVLVGLARVRWGVPLLIGAVLVGSLTASVLLSSQTDPNAFYSLGTRAWELAIGAGLAWLTSVVRTSAPTWARALAFALGLGAIITAAFAFTSSMVWPGSAALLPTVGAALVLWSGTGGTAGPMTRILDNPVARYVGDISFSFYLWHWPVLVLASGSWSNDPRLQFVLVAMSFGLAVLSYHFVEQPFQRMRRSARPRRILSIGLPAAVLVAALSFVGATVVMPNSGVVAPPLRAQYQTLTDGPGTVPAGVPTNVRPSVLNVGYDLQQVYRDCYGPGLSECWSGDPDGTQTVLVTGDSFAGMFWPSLEQAAKDRGWRIVIVARAGCALYGPGPAAGADCSAWSEAAFARAAQIKPDVILYINSMKRVDGPEKPEWVPRAQVALERLAAVAPVLSLAPTPMFLWTSEGCLSSNFFNPSACTLPLEQVVTPETHAIAVDISQQAGVDLLDLNGVLCDAEQRCPMIVDDTIMYRDAGHISNAYSTHFAVIFGDALAPYLD